MFKLTFDEWHEKIWQRAGGLISQSDAARILRKDTSRIAQMIKEKKLKRYQYENISYVSYAEVMEIKQKNQLKKAQKDIDRQVYEEMQDPAIPDDFRHQLEENISKAQMYSIKPPSVVENSICVPYVLEYIDQYDAPEHLSDFSCIIEPDIEED